MTVSPSVHMCRNRGVDGSIRASSLHFPHCPVQFTKLPFICRLWRLLYLSHCQWWRTCSALTAVGCLYHWKLGKVRWHCFRVYLHFMVDGWKCSPHAVYSSELVRSVCVHVFSVFLTLSLLAQKWAKGREG